MKLINIMDYKKDVICYDIETMKECFIVVCMKPEETPKSFVVSKWHNQLDAFVNYLLLDKDKSLLANLKKKDFAAFAKEYNGPAYKKNNYDVKMLKAYQAFSGK